MASYMWLILQYYSLIVCLLLSLRVCTTMDWWQVCTVPDSLGSLSKWIAWNWSIHVMRSSTLLKLSWNSKIFLLFLLLLLQNILCCFLSYLKHCREAAAEMSVTLDLAILLKERLCLIYLCVVSTWHRAWSIYLWTRLLVIWLVFLIIKQQAFVSGSGWSPFAGSRQEQEE